MIIRVFRFLFFIGGIVAGFFAALLLLPLPGKTFFNRMANLPPSVKTLIDDCISLGSAVFRLALTLGREANQKIREAAKNTQGEIKKIRDKIEEAQIIKDMVSKKRIRPSTISK